MSAGGRCCCCGPQLLILYMDDVLLMSREERLVVSCLTQSVAGVDFVVPLQWYRVCGGFRDNGLRSCLAMMNVAQQSY